MAANRAITVPMPDPVATVAAHYDAILTRWQAEIDALHIGALPKKRKRIPPARPAWMNPNLPPPVDKEPAHLAEFRARLTWQALKRELEQSA
jgi:hypothetical protein